METCTKSQLSLSISHEIMMAVIQAAWYKMTKEQGQKQEEQQEVDPRKIEQFISKVINDLGATSNDALAFIGDKLGLFICYWLTEQVCGGYITYDSKSGRYSLPKEHGIALTDESSPAYVAGAFQLVMSALKIEPKVTEAFSKGRGFEWNEHDPGLFEGQARFSTPN